MAIVGYPDARLTEVAVAFVVAEGRAGTSGAPDGSDTVDRSDTPDEALARDLLEYGRGRIASFKLPRHVLFIEELPMTSSGKVRKAELRALAIARPDEPPISPGCGSMAVGEGFGGG